MHAGRRVALLCIDPWDEPQEYHPFNYAVRRVQAALMAAVPDAEVHLIEGTRADPEDFCARIEALAPDVVGASAYAWSFPTFVTVAEQIKQRRPETTIVFGGPSARPAMFSLAPYFHRRFAVDALVLGEGEHTFAEMIRLASRTHETFAAIPGLALPTAQGFLTTSAAPIIEHLDELPSPYELGLVAGNVTAHLETFRGCPLSCTFCQWGESEGSRAFSQEYLMRELLHIKRLGLRQALLVDAGLNLHPRAFRNLVAAEREVRVLKDVGLHFEIYPTRITDAELSFLQEIKLHGIGVGLQSYDREVLRKLERPFDEKRFEGAVRTLATLGGDVGVEIILGLPGDSPESFFRTLERARQLPCDVRVYHCLVLPDALMTRAPAWSHMAFDPYTLKMTSCAGWTEAGLRDTVDKLTRLAEDDGGWSHGLFWFFPQEHRKGASGPRARPVPQPQAQAQASGHGPPSISTHEASAEQEEPPTEVLAREAIEKVAAAVSAATDGALVVSSVERRLGVVLLRATCDRGALTLELEPRQKAQHAYRIAGDVALSHADEEAPLSPQTLRALHLLSQRGAAVLHRLVFPDAPLPLPRSLPLVR